MKAHSSLWSQEEIDFPRFQQYFLLVISFFNAEAGKWYILEIFKTVIC
jgi:hypothetical protein